MHGTRVSDQAMFNALRDMSDKTLERVAEWIGEVRAERARDAGYQLLVDPPFGISEPAQQMPRNDRVVDRSTEELRQRISEWGSR